MAEGLAGTQYCGIPGNMTLDAMATVRDTTAFAESRMITLVLTLDFKSAFDRIAQEYLFPALQNYGIDDSFIAGIKRLYEGATSSVQINGHLHGPITIRCAVCQGYPMSIVLYALCLLPFLLLKMKLPGIWIERRSRPTSVVAYADNVTTFCDLRCRIHHHRGLHPLVPTSIRSTPEPPQI
jgi:hypothetical protein